MKVSSEFSCSPTLTKLTNNRFFKKTHAYSISGENLLRFKKFFPFLYHLYSPPRPFHFYTPPSSIKASEDNLKKDILPYFTLPSLLYIYQSLSISFPIPPYSFTPCPPCPRPTTFQNSTPPSTPFSSISFPMPPPSIYIKIPDSNQKSKAPSLISTQLPTLLPVPSPPPHTQLTFQKLSLPPPLPCSLTSSSS